VPLVIYNCIHFALRVGLFRAGYRRGDQLVATIAKLALPVAADHLRAGGAALCGIAAGLWTFRGLGEGGAAAVVAVMMAALGYAALARGARLLPTAYVATLAGIGAALVLAHFQGSH
jgi:mannose PTS system EIID component